MAKDIVLVPFPKKLKRTGRFLRLRAAKLIRLLSTQTSELLFAGKYLQKVIRDELELDWELTAAAAARMIRHTCRLGRARLIEARKGRRPRLSSLIPEMRSIIAEHRRLWLERSRPGGLSDSVGRLEKLMRCYMK